MKDLSMHVLDIVQNSIVAKAKLIEIIIEVDYTVQTLGLTIKDDGTGMSPELLAKVESPFTTTRTTRNVGLGIPLFKAGAEQSGGSFSLESELGKGTVISAVYGLYHMDRPPLGEVAPSVHMLITVNPEVDFIFIARNNDDTSELDTREVKQVLEGVPLDDPSISAWLMENLAEGFERIFEGVV